MSVAITLTGVRRTFGDVVAVDRLDLTVQPGEILGLLGHNGAGKTTTLRLIAGLLTATTGTVRVGGIDPHTDGKAVRRRLGVLPASAAVDDRMSAAENLRFAADLYDVDRAGLSERIHVLLRRFDLADRADDAAGGFSTGMRQRLSLARVLLHDPDVILLDEPTASLDPVAARAVRDLIAELATQTDRTVVVCTHDLVEAQRLCDRVAILEHGRVLAQGTPGELAGASGDVHVRVHPDDLAAAAAVARPNGMVDGRERLRFPGIPEGDVPRLVHTLSAAGIRIYQLTRSEPNLEEVYLRLHARDDQEVPA
jgi:ABC-2 type transport system ATP-binding protein